MSKPIDEVLAGVIGRAANPPLMDPKKVEEERRLAEETALKWTATLMIAQVVGPVFDKVSKVLAAGHVETCSSSGGGPIDVGPWTLDGAGNREMMYERTRGDDRWACVVVGQFGVGHVGVAASHNRRSYVGVATFSPAEVKQMLDDKDSYFSQIESVVAEAMTMVETMAADQSKV